MKKRLPVQVSLKPLALLGVLLGCSVFPGCAAAVQIANDHLLDSTPVCRPLPGIRAFLKKTNELSNPLDSLTPDSIIELRAQRNQSAAYPLRRIELQRVQDIKIPSVDHHIPIRIYTPSDQSLARAGKLPVVLFVHGGGWTLGSVAAYDSITRELARSIPALVVSVDYRLAPEHPYPAGFDDVYGALQWAGAHIAEFGGDASRIAIVGDSGGANLGTAVALKARQAGDVRVLQQTLFYPSTNISSTDTQSYRDFGEGYVLTRKSVELFRGFYLPRQSDWTNPNVSPLLVTDVSGMPKTLVITAGCDPLRDEGFAYVKKLEKQGVVAEYRNASGLFHGFLNLFNYDKVVSPYAAKSLQYASRVIRKAFEGATDQSSAHAVNSNMRGHSQ